MAYKPVEPSFGTTHNIESLMHALFHLQRTPGVEEAAEQVAKIMREEFMTHPIKKGSDNLPCRIVDGIKYLPNGNVYLATYPGWVLAHIGPWDVEIKEPKQKTRKTPISFSFMKRINLIWYAQIQRRYKRRISFNDEEKMNIQKWIDTLDLRESLPEDERRMLDKQMRSEESIKNVLFNEVKRMLNTVFGFQFSNFYMWHGLRVNTELNHFFFLSDMECDMIIDCIEKNGPVEKYNSASIQALAELFKEIINGRPEGREWIMGVDLDKYKTTKQVERTRWGRTDIDTITIYDSKGIYQHYLEQLEDCSDEQLKLFSKIGIEIKKEDA